jgi:ketosteroid isomerase-like protein
MTAASPDTSLDPERFVAALVGRDADALAALYADDAVVTLHDQDHPPGAPIVLEGRGAIHDWYRDVCGRNIEHVVPELIGNAAGFAFEEHCRYPDGGGVVCLSVATVEDGRITRQTASQTWDT